MCCKCEWVSTLASVRGRMENVPLLWTVGAVQGAPTRQLLRARRLFSPSRDPASNSLGGNRARTGMTPSQSILLQVPSFSPKPSTAHSLARSASPQ